MEKRRVLITGLGTVNPLGHNAADTWQAVRDGVCGIGPITRYDCSAQKVHLAAEVKDWDPTTVLDKKDVRHMSRYTQLAAAAAKEALADSGLDREKEDLTRCGVIVSSGVGGIEMAESEELRCSQKGFDRASPFYIPTTIANRIIKAVKDRCPILARATIYNVKGTLKVPVWGKANTTHDIAVGYQTEFTEITADSGKFTSVDLGGYLAGALTLIGKSVENNGSFSVVDFIVNQMAEEIATWIEGQLLVGTGSSAAQGATNTTTVLTAASATAITADELIDLQAKVKQAYQANACWIMNPATFTAIKKLKDGNNRYLLQDDVTGEFPFRLLGKPVFLSDNMPAIAASAKAVLYGDCSGLSVNFRENISIQVLQEKYATQHAIGVVSWFEFDSKVTDNQKLAVLTMKAGA